MAKARARVVVGFVGAELDRGTRPDRWTRWRPTVSLAQHDDLALDRLELLCDPRHRALAETVAGDVARASPETEVRVVDLPLNDPWDFEEVYAALHDWRGRTRGDRRGRTTSCTSPRAPTSARFASFC